MQIRRPRTEGRKKAENRIPRMAWSDGRLPRQSGGQFGALREWRAERNPVKSKRH